MKISRFVAKVALGFAAFVLFWIGFAFFASLASGQVEGVDTPEEANALVEQFTDDEGEVDWKLLGLTVLNGLVTSGVMGQIDKRMKKRQRRKNRNAKVKRFFGSLLTSIVLPGAAAALAPGVSIGNGIAMAAGGWLTSQGINNGRRSLRKERASRTRATD